MEITKIREKMRLILDERNLTMREVSLKAGLSHNAMANIMSRNSKRVNTRHLRKLLDAMGIPFGSFWEGGSELPTSPEISPPAITPPEGMAWATLPPQNVPVPICGTISAGPFRLTEPQHAQQFYLGGRADRDSFILGISGDSMFPEYGNGELIFLKKTSIHFPPLPNGRTVGVPLAQVQHLHGKDCVVFMEHEGCTFKRIILDSGPDLAYTLTLAPVNPAYNKTTLRPEHDMWVQGICYKSVRER